MRDVSAKTSSLRTATAAATLRVSPATIALIRAGEAPKGDPLPVARVAAIQAAKATPTIIPYCHPIPVDYVGVEFELRDDSIEVVVDVSAVYKTGVEMEALTAAAAAALNLFDLLKPVDEAMEIASVRLLEKTGGKSQFRVSDSFAVGIVVVSDSVSKGATVDRSGGLLRDSMARHGGTVVDMHVVPDDEDTIRSVVGAMIRLDPSPDLVFLTGGTGAGPRDRTPEAVIPMLDARLTGIEHRLHTFAQERLPGAMLGRPFAGLIDHTVVVGVPGSPGAVQDAVEALFPYLKHAFHIVGGGGHGR